MLSDAQIMEIREHLERAVNPIFFYDNDADGFFSHVLLRRFAGKGKGVAVRSHPDIDVGYTRKVHELKGDCVFVLDRPHLGKAFVEEIKQLNLPIIWIDHHDTIVEDYGYENLFAYNPLRGEEKSAEPVTYMSYKITGRKEDLWIAVMGCIADHYLPDFTEEFGERHPEFWGKNVKEPFDVYYSTGIGRLAQAIAFGLKDSITHVVQLQNFMVACKSPSDMYAELESSSAFGKKYREVKEKYDGIINKAKESVEEDIVFFVYGGTMSMSSEIANHLSYTYPNKIIVAAYTQGVMSNISIRGDNVKGIIDKLFKDFENSSGGGHRDAVGCRLRTEDLERFKSEILRELRERKKGR